jgi:hypothetical protein
VRVKQARTQSAVFQLVGACLLAVVVLAHVAEGLPLLPGLEWGQPHSVGTTWTSSASLPESGSSSPPSSAG